MTIKKGSQGFTFEFNQKPTLQEIKNLEKSAFNIEKAGFAVCFLMNSGEYHHIKSEEFKKIANIIKQR